MILLRIRAGVWSLAQVSRESFVGRFYWKIWVRWSFQIENWEWNFTL